LENNPQFFYPPAKQAPSVPRGSVSGKAATITVAEVPLILLGHKLPVLRERADLSYAALVAQSRQGRIARYTIALSKGRIHFS
jgi:hypothetical protein